MPELGHKNKSGPSTKDAPSQTTAHRLYGAAKATGAKQHTVGGAYATETYCSIVWEATSPRSRCQQFAPSEGSEENLFHACHLASGGLLHSLAWRSIPHISGFHGGLCVPVSKGPLYIRTSVILDESLPQ